MNTKLESALFTAVLKVMTPLARILLRNGVSHGVFSELAKRAYVKVAEKEFKVPQKKQSTSYIASITGLTRKEVLRIRKLPEITELESLERYDRLTRIISGWIRLPEFLNENGEPAILPFSGEEGSFSSLVKQIGADIPARSILNELERVEAVRILNGSQISLESRAYITRGDNVAQINILGIDVGDLISTISHNMTCTKEQPFLQRKVCYNNIPDELLPALQHIIIEKAQLALEDINFEMSKYDRDSNPDVKGTGQNRTGIGIYYFKESSEAHSDDVISKDSNKVMHEDD